MLSGTSSYHWAERVWSDIAHYTNIIKTSPIFFSPFWLWALWEEADLQKWFPVPNVKQHRGALSYIAYSIAFGLIIVIYSWAMYISAASKSLCTQMTWRTGVLLPQHNYVFELGYRIFDFSRMESETEKQSLSKAIGVIVDHKLNMSQWHQNANTILRHKHNSDL